MDLIVKNDPESLENVKIYFPLIQWMRAGAAGALVLHTFYNWIFFNAFYGFDV